MPRFILIFCLSALLLSCTGNDTKQKELELKERELALKEKELELREKGNKKDTTSAIPKTEDAPINITYQTQTVSLNVDMQFFKGTRLLFYYDEKTKGKIIIDNVTYPLSSGKRTDKGKFVNYTYTGSHITIKAINGKFDEIGEDEERDVYAGKIQTLIVTTDKGSVTIKNVDFSYSVMSGM
jgi:hypothetical protein